MANRVSPIWHPMTQHKIAGPSIHVDRAEGAHLFVRGGRKIIDGIYSAHVIRPESRRGKFAGFFM